MTPLPQRPGGLPDFEHPPLHEVAVAVLFSPLHRMAQAHVGEFWNQIQSSYPQMSDHPPLDPVFEAGRGQPQLHFRLGLPPLRRTWFVSEDDARIVQVQDDRFVHNWRRRASGYPHLEKVWEEFLQRWQQFSDFVDGVSIGPARPVQLELSYFNQVPASPWSGLSIATLPKRWDSDQPTLSLDLRLEQSGPNGALYVTCRTAENEQMSIDLTYRESLADGDVENLAAAVGRGRARIVRTFTDMTESSLHDEWGRTK